jgi:hypothetical protein
MERYSRHRENTVAKSLKHETLGITKGFSRNKESQQAARTLNPLFRLWDFTQRMEEKKHNEEAMKLEFWTQYPNSWDSTYQV